MKRTETDLTIYHRRLNDLRNNVCLGHREANTEPILFTLLEQLGIDTNEPLTFIRQYRGNTSSKKHVDFCIVLNNGNKILIELKPFSEKLYKTLESRFSQIEEYISIMKDINVIILTNGALFYFYRRETVRDTFELNPFLTIDMDDIENEQLYLHCFELLFYNNFSNDSINAVISVIGTPQINRLKDQLLNGQIQKDDCYINDAEEASNNTFFGKTIDFKNDCFRVDILPDKVQNILFFGNLINIFGSFNNKERMSDNMKDNIQYIKNIIKKNPNVTLHIYGNRKMRKYFKKCFINLGIDIKKNVSFDSINSIEELTDKIKDMKFDVAILNPPYKDRLYIDILSVIANKSDRMLFVSPLSWILSKPGSNDILRLAHIYKCVIKYIDAFKFFGRNGNRFSGITYIDKTVREKQFTLNECSYDKADGLVYIHGFKGIPAIYNKILSIIDDNVDNHIYYSKYVTNNPCFKKKRMEQSDNVWCVIIPQSIGDKFSMDTNQSKCIIRPKDVNNNTIIKRYNDLAENDKFYIPAKSKKEAINIVKYLMTDFARLCLFFLSAGGVNLISNHYTKYIMWLEDFEDDALFSGTIDEISNRLFKKCGITLSEEQKAFIEDKFPKVYDLKDNMYEYKS